MNPWLNASSKMILACVREEIRTVAFLGRECGKAVGKARAKLMRQMSDRLLDILGLALILHQRCRDSVSATLCETVERIEAWALRQLDMVTSCHRVATGRPV